MLKLPKHVEHDAWQNRHDGRSGDRPRIKASPNDRTNLTEFTIEIFKCAARGEASFTLLGRPSGYPEHALCRYEIQLVRHTNPKWFEPVFIGPRALHKHVYNERAIREDFPWDKCAEPLALKSHPRRRLSLEQAINRIAPIFLKELCVEILDRDTMSMFHGGG
jgi:hypothetical protein